MRTKTIGLIATARHFSEESTHPFCHDLHQKGYQTVIGNSIGTKENQMAGSPQWRAEDLKSMLQNPEIDAICCVKGGYGTAQIIDLIDWKKMPQKPLFGFSDITALHCHFQRLGWQSYHSPMASTWKNSTDLAKKMFFDALEDKQLNYSFSANKFNRIGKATAPIIGGNLSVLYSILGSNSFPNLDGKILFLEDLDEYLYHLDRMLLNLKRAKKLDKLAALVIGGFTDMHDNEIPFGQNAHEIIAKYTQEFSYPLAFNFSAGHINENLTIRFGSPAKLTVETDACQLIIT